MANSSPKGNGNGNAKAKGKTLRKVTRRSPRTRILEELDAVKAMVAKHCITDARQPVKVVAPVELAPVLETMPLPKTVVEEKVMVPVPAKKKVISCPGGPKAFNEFIQQYRAAHPGMNYQTALKQGGPEWKAKCGAAPTVKKNKTNKNKPKTLLVATSSTGNKPKAVRKTAVKKANKGFAAPVGFTQAAPLAKESAAYNPFDEFEATAPLPPPPPQKSNVAAVVTSANTNGNKGKIGNWKVIRRNANTELNVLQNPKGEKVFKTAQNEVFGLEYDAKGNEVFGELIGLMRPDGTINTNVSPSNFEEA